MAAVQVARRRARSGDNALAYSPSSSPVSVTSQVSFFSVSRVTMAVFCSEEVSSSKPSSKRLSRRREESRWMISRCLRTPSPHPTQKAQPHNHHHGGKHRRQKEAAAHRHPDAGQHEDGGGGRQPVHRAAAADDGPGADEADAGEGLGGEAG